MTITYWTGWEGYAIIIPIIIIGIILYLKNTMSQKSYIDKLNEQYNEIKNRKL